MYEVKNIHGKSGFIFGGIFVVVGFIFLVVFYSLFLSDITKK